MEKYELDNQQEKEHKRRGFFITITIHTILLCLAFFPLMGAIQDIKLNENEIEFVNTDDIIIESPEVKFVENAEDKSRKNQSNEDSKSKEQEVQQEPTPPPPPQPDPKPVEVVEDEETQPVVTSDNQKTNEVKTNEAPKVEPTPDPEPNASVPQGSKTPANDNKSGGTAPNNTHASGDGGNDDNLQEGVFGRKVKKRPNIKGLTKKQGKIAVKVCVSQEGTVIATKFLSKYSTIHEAKLIAAAMRAARRYKFDVDYTAPKKQWGKLTFIFDLD